jgi:hypothetical protein
MAKVGWVGALTAFALAGCGDDGNQEACDDADEVALGIERSAMLDGLPPEGVCLDTEQQLAKRLEQTGHFNASTGAERAAQYRANCERYQNLVDECKGK